MTGPAQGYGSPEYRPPQGYAPGYGRAGDGRPGPPPGAWPGAAGLPMTGPGRRAPAGWPGERRGASFGVPVAVIGALLAVLGFFALDWAARVDFFDARHAVVDLSSSRFNPFTQVYFLALWLPLLVVTAAVGVCVTLGPVAARIGTLVAGIAGGLSLIGLVVWIETGHIGSDRSRADAEAGLVLLAVGGLVTIVLGIVAYREKRAVLARVLAAVLAGVASIAQLAVVNDLFPDTSKASVGAWAPALGFALLLGAALVPHRRVR